MMVSEFCKVNGHAALGFWKKITRQNLVKCYNPDNF